MVNIIGTTFAKVHGKTVQKYVLGIYLLLVSIVIIYAFAFFYDTNIIKQPWYFPVGYTFALGFLFAAEIFATTTDILLIRSIASQVGGTESEATKARKRQMYRTFFVIWSLMFFDVVSRQCIFSIYVPVSNLTRPSLSLIMMVLRTRSNLEYGLLLKQVLFDRTDGTEGHQSDPKKMTTSNGPAYESNVKSSDKSGSIAQYGTAAKSSNAHSVV
jgi:hypothetical protein